MQGQKGGDGVATPHVIGLAVVSILSIRCDRHVIDLGAFGVSLALIHILPLRCTHLAGKLCAAGALPDKLPRLCTLMHLDGYSLSGWWRQIGAKSCKPASIRGAGKGY